MPRNRSQIWSGNWQRGRRTRPIPPSPLLPTDWLATKGRAAESTRASGSRVLSLGILPTGCSAEANLPTGGMDSTAHPEVFLATVARPHRAGARATQAGGSCPATPDSADGPGGLAHGEDCDHARGAEGQHATSFRLPAAIRSCGRVRAAEFNRRMRKTARPVVWEVVSRRSESVLLYER